MPRETRTVAELPAETQTALLTDARRTQSVAAVRADTFPTLDEIATRIDQVFADHSAAQRALLTRLARLVVHLARATGVDP